MRKLLIIFAFALLWAGCNAADGGFQQIDVAPGSIGSPSDSVNQDAALPVTTLAIQPAYTKIVGIGQTLQLTTDIYLDDGEVVNDVQKSFALPGDTLDSFDLQWDTENFGVATVDDYGLVTAVSAGDTFIHATIDGHDAIARVIVEAESNGDPNVDISQNP